MSSNRMTRASLISVFFSTLILANSHLHALTVYYVDAAKGNDDNPGTELLPWATIQKAAGTLVAGDTAIVRAGDYQERVTIHQSGSAGQPISFQAENAVIMKGFTVYGDYIQIKGFEITDPDGLHLPAAPRAAGRVELAPAGGRAVVEVFPV